MSKEDYNLGYEEGQRDAQARIAELEAQVAELARLGSYVSYQALGTAEQELGDAIANLPAAVQRHLARDRAAEGLVEWVENLLWHGAAPDAEAAGESLLAAYHAASKEE